MSIKAENLSWSAGNRLIVDDVSLSVATGETVGLIGPNGSGKSSLLRLLASIRQPDRGGVLIGDRDIRSISRRDLARQVALVQQHAATDLQITVHEVVRLGRTPYRAAFAGWSRQDEAAVSEALERTGMQGFRDHMWQQLSGGERQRVHIAKALAQQPSILFLDEPTNHLDIEHQLGILQLVRQQGLTCVIALHDLNHAAMFCDRLLVLKGGKLVNSGRPHEVLNPETLRSIFHVEGVIETSDYHGKPHIQFLGGLISQ
ncbi:ABC transporter ATP-binding protein [uncultured Cohaesibacter sp.]|uniref:ABC transporter ATP-binding protein n=1 Tax=uncultured Cohaesibacter sp. TaxID=1002546 RepID=UPI0029C78C05|nr:ABC transporter ATP-binding protein [uncultured Cohaesibacter sp.]